MLSTREQIIKNYAKFIHLFKNGIIKASQFGSTSAFDTPPKLVGHRVNSIPVVMEESTSIVSMDTNPWLYRFVPSGENC